MTYETAKKLKDCTKCKSSYKPGSNKSIYCKPCAKLVRSEKMPAWQRSYYIKNKETINQKAVARQNFKRKTDPNFREKEKTKYHKRRSLIEGNGGFHTTNEWLSLVALFGGKCADCQESKLLTRDHIIPISRGGTNDITNIQPLCGSCNSSKGAKLTYA